MSKITEYLRRTKREGFTREPYEQRQASPVSGEAAMLPGDQFDPNAQGSHDAAIPEGSIGQLPEENPDPLKQRIFPLPSRKPLDRLIRALWERRPGRPLTPEEKSYNDERARRRAMEHVLREESDLYADRIIAALNRRELCYRYKKSEKDLFVSGIHSVRFDCVVMQPDAIYLRVDTKHLPRGVGILSLVDSGILTDLSLACGRRVSAEYSERVGCWYIIERASGFRGIPNHVKYTDMLSKFPASADGLSIPLGMTSNSRPVYRSLGQMYSMLVGGTIGSGKSNALNIILCTLIRRNSSQRLKLLMVDLKGGLEFSFYEGIPHLLSVPEICEKGIIYYREQVPDLLRWLVQEGERRIEILRGAGYKDIGRYNQKHRKHHIPHLVFVIDEWADIKLEPKTGREAEDLLTNIAQRFRAVGIHVIVCTQVPKSEIVSTRIKGVLPAKLAFSCPTNQASMAILDNGHAKGLEPAGRCILQWTDEIQIQTPYITDQFVMDTVQGARKGEFEEVVLGHDVTPLEVMEWALESDNGFLSLIRLYQNFKSRELPKHELERWLQEWEGNEYVIGTSLYRVEPAAGKRARRLVAVTEEEEKPEEEPTIKEA